MSRSRIRCTLSILLFQFLIAVSAPGQAFFAAPANFGGTIGSGLFQAQGGTVTQINTGFVEHNFPQVSRSGTLIAFSSPDPVEAPLQVPPSSDIYVFSRSTNQTFRVVDHNTIIFSPSEVNSFTPVSAAISPNNQLLAYGVVLTRRQGLANPQSTRELNIARLSDGVIVDNPTFGRGPVTDAFQGEFVGISWDPSGESFVTTTYVTVNGSSGLPTQLPAVVRYSRTQGTNDWNISNVLSGPQYFDTQIPTSAITSMYPALSPSGTGLAYFEIFWPDALAIQPDNQQTLEGSVTCRVIIANSDGSNPEVLFTFNQGLFPAGLTWSPDGTQLGISFAPQVFFEGNFLPLADRSDTSLRQLSTSSGQITLIPGVDAGYFPSWIQSFSSGSLSNAQLEIRPAGNGNFRIFGRGLEAGETYFLHSSESLAPGSFGTPQSFTAEQLTSGIDLILPTPTRFFRLVDPSF